MYFSSGVLKSCQLLVHTVLKVYICRMVWMENVCDSFFLSVVDMPRKIGLGRARKNAERNRQNQNRSLGVSKIGRPSKKVGHL